jgi:Cys-tRNA(Pro)/Cys-tRNA(Cys) deacylase
MAKKDEKTNVMRVLEQKGIDYKGYTYDPEPDLSGGEVARLLGEDPDRVFKTLVTTNGKNKYFVFLVPVCRELHLKKAAKTVGEKSIEMVKSKELLPLTGYIHGGCSPIGMKKRFPSFIHGSASGLSRIFVSAGRVGCQVELAPEDLIRIAELKPADLV